MTNYYTEASFIIPCNTCQVTIAFKALSAITDGNTVDFDTLMSRKPDNGLLREEVIIRHCLNHHPDRLPESGHYPDFWDFDAFQTDDGIWIRANESINTEHAAIFTEAVLAAFNLPHLVVIEAAHTCDKARLDAFGGHACTVTKNGIIWHDYNDSLEATRQAHLNGERYYMCSITQINGEYEYTSLFLMKCDRDDDPDERMDSIFVNYNGKGEKTNENFVWYPDGLAGKDPSFNEITPDEYRVMQRHLGVL